MSAQSIPQDYWAVTGPWVMNADKYLNGSNGYDLEKDLLLCLEGGADSLVLDCDALTYMTGAGVRSLVNVARAAQTKGASFRLCNLKGQPHEIFNACGAYAFVPETVAAAWAPAPAPVLSVVS